MEYKAIGLVETNSVAKGIQAADDMLKTSDVELIMARPVCPGKYLAMISGDVGSVQNSVEAGENCAGEFVADTFIIANVHESIFPALNCANQILNMRALGIIETFSVASCILASDAAAKSADVDLIELRCATGLAGKSFITLTGDIGSVDAAVSAGMEAIESKGLIHSFAVIPAPSYDLHQWLV